MEPGRSSNEKRDMYVFGGVIGALVVLYLTLTVAGALGGGRGNGGLFSLVSIGNWLNAFGHGIRPWAIVGDYSVNAIVFWSVFLVMWAAIGAAVYWGRVFWLGGTVHRSALSSKKSGAMPEEVHWAKAWELAPLWKKGASKNRWAMQGIFLGKMPDRNGREHVLRADGRTSTLVFGPTGSGKTTGLLVPNVLYHDGPLVVTSTKYELIQLTAGHRSKIGPVWVYDPTDELRDVHGIKSAHWSPLPRCTTAEQAILTAKWFAQGVRGKNNGGSSNDWEHWAQKIWNIAAPCLYVAAHNNMTMDDVRGLVFRSEFKKIQQMLEVMPDSNDKEKMLELTEAVLHIEPKERSTAFSVTQRIFNPFWSQHVADNSETNQIDAHRLLTQKGTLYLQTPAQSPEEVAPLFVAILEEILIEAKKLARFDPNERIPYPLLLALDELANVCHIEDLAHIASEGAGRGVLLLSILQDYSQLEQIYGEKDARTILNNHPAKLALPGITDPQTAELVCKILGSGSATSISVSESSGGQSGGGGSKTLSHQDRALMTPDRLQRMFDGTAVLMHRGLQPALINQLVYYEDEALIALTEKEFNPVFERIIDGDEDDFEEDDLKLDATGLLERLRNWAQMVPMLRDHI